MTLVRDGDVGAVRRGGPGDGHDEPGVVDLAS